MRDKELCLDETSKKLIFLYKYWENLKSRKSYEDGILNYYTDKEKDLLSEFNKNNNSSVLKAIIEEIDKRKITPMKRFGTVKYD